MAKSFRVDIDSSELLKFSEALGQLGGSLSKPTSEAVNLTAEAAFDEARKRMLQKVNLSESYVDSKVKIHQRATESKPEAVIQADGDLTVLGRFDAKPVVVAAKSNPKKLKGNPFLGLAPGQKQQGAKVTVTRGQTSDAFVPRGFILPLKAGKVAGGNGPGVFARNREGKRVHRYGPSPYQMFAQELEGGMTIEVNGWLVENLNRAVTEHIKKGLPWLS